MRSGGGWWRSEEGLTLVDLAMALALMAVAVTISSVFLYATQRTLARQQERSVNNDHVRLAVEQLDREIRSGNILYPPSGTDLRIYTQSNAPSAGGYRCVEWSITDRELRRREWPPTFGVEPDPDDVSAWSIVAEHVVNADVGVDAFTLANSRTVEISILVNSALAQRPDSTVRVDTAITGRNTTFNYPSNACDPGPA